jgi:[CysO sulfur-carrier protein]-S-L-cysteine hydrolase
LGYNSHRSTGLQIRPRLAKLAVMRQLTLRNEHRQAMLDHVRGLWPEEACGLLAGLSGQVKRVYLIENVRHSRTDYFMDPNQQVKAMLEIEVAGWEVCSIFHSHPAGRPQPSQTDIDRAYYPDAVYIILAPADGPQWAMRGFAITAGQVREVPIEIGA